MDTFEVFRHVFARRLPVLNAADRQPSAQPEFGKKPFTRRRFIQASLAVPTLFALSACGKGDAAPAMVTRTFFSADEHRFIEAVTARLIPGTTDDPGAVEAGVPYFIDLQLAGPFGRADRWYMDGPWSAGTDQQGYQLKETPAQLYRKAIWAIDDYCRGQFNRKKFAELTDEQQDRLLHDLEEDKVELKEVPASAFFKLLWKNTQEGFLSDPMYGGNRNFAGWKLIGFPGPRYNYVKEVTEYGKPYSMPTVGLLGRRGTTTNSIKEQGWQRD